MAPFHHLSRKAIVPNAVFVNAHYGVLIFTNTSHTSYEEWTPRGQGPQPYTTTQQTIEYYQFSLLKDLEDFVSACYQEKPDRKDIVVLNVNKSTIPQLKTTIAL